MTAPKRRRRPQLHQRAVSTAGPLSVLVKALVAALLVARLLVPAESAAEGETLWLVQLWLPVGVLWAWSVYREGPVRIRWDWCDAAVWVLVAGHVVSAAYVIATVGHKRAAINMLWEWVALGLSFFLVRQIVRTREDGRRLMSAMITTTICLAGLGLWQHYVFYPEARAEYSLQRVELDKLLQTAPVPQSRNALIKRSQRIRELQAEFFAQDIPLEGPGRSLFEGRLQSSSEPSGSFALANTFAGLLIVWLIAGLGLLISVGRQSRTWWGSIIGGSLVLLIVYCLVLTKSRTAWFGLCVGLLIWGVLQVRGSAGWPKKWLAIGLTVCGLLGGLVSLAALTRGFDLEVVTEAPKSLRYRAQYWTGAWNVVRERPILGTGPGNFRQHYLKHKLPESSEEIVDPHNLLLDVWTSGGLLGVAGLAGLIAAGVWVFRRAQSSGFGDRNDSGPSTITGALWDPLTIGAGLSFVAVFGWNMYLEQSLDLRLLLLPAWWLLLAGSGKISNSVSVPNVCLAAGCGALLVHLLGAGGIEMPAVVQTLLVLLALGSVSQETADAEASSVGPVLVLGGILLVLSFACLRVAFWPHYNRNNLIAAGDDARKTNFGSLQAARLYADAAKADPFSPSPAGRMANLYFSRWQQFSAAFDEDFATAVRFQRLAIEQNPDSFGGYRVLGEWYARRFHRTDDPADASQAVEEFRKAAERYPHNAALRAELALSLAEAGQIQQARKAAQQALLQDEINHQEGHQDKFLSKEKLDALGRLRG